MTTERPRGDGEDLFRDRQKVLFHHCDPAGIVFYPRYFEMVNAAIERWFSDRLKVPFEQLHGAMGAAVPTASLTAEFHAPSRHGDRLEFRLRPTRLGRASVEITVDAWCDLDKRLTMAATLVLIDKTDGRPQAWPEDLRRRLESELETLVAENA